MLTIEGTKIKRDGTRAGRLDDMYLRDADDKRIGYWQDDWIYDYSGKKLAYLDSGYLYDAYDRSSYIPLADVLKKVKGDGEDIVKCAAYRLLDQ